MEASVLQTLHRKLAELERRIEAYRQDLLSEFQLYCRDILRDVAPTEARDLQQAIAASFSSYPSLRPEPSDFGPDSHQKATSIAIHQSPTNSESESSEERNRPHQREVDFQGLFTPTYLPLLDTFSIKQTPDAVRSGPPASPSAPANETSSSPTLQSMNGQRIDGGDSSERPGLLPTIFQLSRNGSQTTDSTIPSALPPVIMKTPKSALRRSSSSLRQSHNPRRVRFEFMGAEVSPTESPQMTAFALARPPSPGSDDDAICESNLGGDIGEEEEEAFPRKISSSDALRALSRAPLEGSLSWTVVNPEASETTSESSDPTPDVRSEYPLQRASPSPSSTPSRSPISNLRNVLPPLRPTENDEGGAEHGMGSDDGNSSDSSSDGFLAMRPSRPSTIHFSQRRTSIRDGDRTASSLLTAPTHNGQLAKKLDEENEQLPLGAEEDEEQDEELFYFEAGNSKGQPRPKFRPPLEEEEEEEEEEEKEKDDDDDNDAADDLSPSGESDTSPVDSSENQLSMYATSPAVPIRRSSDSHSRTSTSSATRFQPGSVGSYKGRPLTMPIVRNPEVLAQASTSAAQTAAVIGGVEAGTDMGIDPSPPMPGT